MANIQIPTENVDIQNETDFELAERGALVQKYEALERLKENEDFKTVFIDGYFKEKAIELTSLLATEYVRQNGLRGAIMEELVAISVCEDYLHTIEQLGAPIVEDEYED